MSTTPSTAPSTGLTRAHVMPVAVFMGFLLLRDALGFFGLVNSSESAPWWQRQPELWLYPLQTLVTFAVLASFRKHWEFRPLRGIGLAVLLGILGIAIWITPGFLARSFELRIPILSYFGVKSRTSGFDPGLLLESGSGLYWAVIALRFLRLVVVVPLAEELFWRGFLMRYLLNPDGDFWSVRFGTFHWKSFAIVTGLFIAIHSSADYFGAAVFGSLMYLLAVRSKSLFACVLMHAVANLLLGLYVLSTGQWGYW